MRCNVQEVRELRFWFKSTVAEERRNELTEDFFKDLLNPTDFPTGLLSSHSAVWLLWISSVSVLWHCWFGHMTCENRPRYDL